MEDKAIPILPKKIKLNSLGRKQYRLFLDDEKISFNDTVIYLAQISGLKFGITLMQFYRFSLGRKYIFSIKCPDKEINLVFKSYFGLEKDYFNALFYQIVDVIWDRISDRLFADLVQQLKSETGSTVGHCVFRRQGITINRHNLFSAQEAFIPWKDLTYKKNYNRLSLYSKSNSQIWTNLFYTETWNVDMAILILDWLYEQNGFAALNSDTIN